MLLKFIKFGCVGFVNACVDLGILNILMFITGQGREGILFSVFKTFSFTAAVINSYYLNKLWVFKGQGQKKESMQFSAFLLVSIIGGLVNVSVATLIVSYVHIMLAHPHLLPTVAAICGSFVAMSWNFLGYNFIVFKEKKTDQVTEANLAEI